MAETVLALSFVSSQLDERTLSRTSCINAATYFTVLSGAALSPLIWNWLDTRQMNANFVYAAGIGLSAAQLLFCHDVVLAALRAERAEEEECLHAKQARLDPEPEEQAIHARVRRRAHRTASPSGAPQSSGRRDAAQSSSGRVGARNQTTARRAKQA